jgi:hypothetical protein
MSRPKKPASEKSSRKTAPVLGVAGVTLLAGASAALAYAPSDYATDVRGNKVVLGDEEVSDVSLATFYAIEREGEPTVRRVRLSMGACSGCGCGCSCGCGCWGGDYLGPGPTPLIQNGYAVPPQPVRPVRKYRRTYNR